MFSRSTVVALTASILATTACTALRQDSAVDHERTLSAAGFQMKMADTEKKAAHVAALPQRKLTRVSHQGENRWVYADAEFCKCVYMGSEKAYDRLQAILMEKKIAMEQMDEMEGPVVVDWGGWGPWGPWY